MDMGGAALLAATAGREILLADLDGTLCSVFGDTAPEVAAHVRESLEARLGVQLLPANPADPLDVYRAAAALGSREARLAHLVLEDAERGAAKDALPLPGAATLLLAVQMRGIALGIVTSNGPDAARIALEASFGTLWHGLSSRMTTVLCGREPLLPLKPHPAQVERALELLHAEPWEAVMIGDSPADMSAARRARVRAVGLPLTGARAGAEALARAGANALALSPAAVAETLAGDVVLALSGLGEAAAERGCGCRADPAVFGHTCVGAPAPPVAA